MKGPDQVGDCCLGCGQKKGQRWGAAVRSGMEATESQEQCDLQVMARIQSLRDILIFWLKAPIFAKSKMGKKHAEEEPRCPSIKTTNKFSRSLLGRLPVSRQVSVKLT